MAEPTNVFDGQVDDESVLVITLAKDLMAETNLAGIAADDQAENDLSALSCRLHFCVVGVCQVGPVLEALLCHVEIIKANDRNFVITTDMCTTLFAKSAAFDAFFTPAPTGPMCDAVELYVGSRRLFR